MHTRAAAIFGLGLVLLLPSCTMYSKPKSGFAGATGGEQLEKQFWEDIRQKDWKELDQHLAPMFVSTSPDGTSDRAASLERWKQWNLQSVTLADVKVQSAGADFVVTATVNLTGTFAGQPAPAQPVHSMTVWQQVSKGFIIVAHSDTLP